MKTYLAILFLTLSALSSGRAKPITVSKLKIAPEAVLSGWELRPGLTIDSLASYQIPADAPANFREMIEMLRKALPKEAIGVADYSYSSDPRATKLVTLNVIQFENARAAQEYWKKKFDVLQQTGQVRQVENNAFPAYEYVGGLQKRFVLQGAFWLSASQLAEGTEYLAVLEAYSKKLKELQNSTAP